MKHTIVYSSDLHGNVTQYKKLVSYAHKINADSVIIGGDIAPKGIKIDKYIKTQRKFLAEKLPSLLQPLKKAGIVVYLMMGNDDCKANMDILEQENGKLYYSIHDQRLKLTDDLDLVGYSNVPLTPFGIKDWEKFDFGDIPETFRRTYHQRNKRNRLDGAISKSNEWIPFLFTPDLEKKDSIQKDLSNPLFMDNAAKTVYVMHSPPSDTALDIIHSGERVGSMAERLFIEKMQPHLTLHGHIHETVDMSGTFKQRIGKTWCFASGNHNVGPNLAVIVLDLYQPEQARRIIL